MKNIGHEIRSFLWQKPREMVFFCISNPFIIASLFLSNFIFFILIIIFIYLTAVLITHEIRL